MPDRCQYELDIEIWEEEHDRECELDPDEEIVKDGVWHCPHDAVEGHEECIFHLAPEERPRDASEVFVEAVEGDAPNQFIGAVFPEFDLSGRELNAEEVVDLRHARVGDLDWNDATVGVDIDARGTEVGDAGMVKSESAVGQADFEGATFDWLNLGRASFREPVTFKGAKFRSGAPFWEAEFREVSFYEAEFRGWADFRRVKFGDEADFQRTEFGGRVNFLEAESGGEAYFRKAEFEDVTSFREVEFGSEANFYRAEFKGETYFWEAEFGDKAYFRKTEFGDKAYFRRAEFGGEVDFREAEFGCEVNFWEAEFGGEAYFLEAEFGGETYFWEAEFQDDVTFRDVESEEGLDLSNMNLKQANFRDADLSNANFEDADLSRAALYGTDLTNAKLYGARLTDARINDATDFGIRNRGRKLLSRSPRLLPTPEVIYDPRTEPTPDDDNEVSDYTKAATVYAELESLAGDNAAPKLAHKCFAWRKDMQRKRYFSEDGDGNDRELFAWGRAWLANILMRYGESPYRLFGWAGLIVLVWGLLYDYFDLLRATGENVDPNPSLLDALYFSTLTFTTLGMGDYRPADQWGRLLAIGETALGVILLALLVFVVGRRATR